MCSTRLLMSSLSVSKSEQLDDSDCILLKLGAHMSKRDIDKLPGLKYIGMLGTGYGGIDATYAASKGISVTNIANYATEGVGEFTFAILLEYLRSVCKAKQQAENDDYSDINGGREVKGQSFGVVGLGDIGLRTAELAQAFGANVSYWSRNRKVTAENQGIAYDPKVWSKADIITVNLELNTETEKFMNTERIAKIKKGAVVINLSPMELFDFSALVSRLKKNDMTFILDHSDEMTKQQLSTLQALDNCIIYPPIAYLTQEASTLKKQIYIDNLASFLSGIPANQVN